MNTNMTTPGGSLTEQIFDFIAEMTVDAHHSFLEHRARLSLTTPLRDQQPLIEQIERRFGVSVQVPNPWNTTIGAVLEGIGSP